MTIATFSIMVLYIFCQTIGLAAVFVGWWPGQKMGWRIFCSVISWYVFASLFNLFFQTMGSNSRVPLVGDPRVVTIATVFCFLAIALIYAIAKEFREE